MSNNVTSNLSIGITMDTKQMQTESRRVAALLRGVKKDLAAYGTQIEDLKKRYKAEEIGLAEYTVALNRIELARAKSVAKINEEAEALRKLKMAGVEAANAQKAQDDAADAERAAVAQKEFADETARLRREAERAAEAQRKMAQSVKESLNAQRQASFERATRTSQRLDPTELYRAGLADIEAMKATGGLTPEAERRLMQELVDKANELDAEVQQITRDQREYTEELRRSAIEAAKLAGLRDKEFGDEVKRLRAEAEEIQQRVAKGNDEAFSEDVKRLRKEAEDLRQRIATSRNEEFGDEVKRLRAEAISERERQSRSRDDEFANNIQRLRQESVERRRLADQGRQYMSQYYTEQQRVRSSFREILQLQRQGVLTEQQAAIAVRNVRYEASLTAKTFDQLKMAASGILAPIAVAYTTYQAIQKVIRDTVEFENARASFKVFTGSERGADKVLAELRQFTTENPVSFAASQRTTRTLLQYGVAAEDAVDITKRLAEVAGGNAERMENLGLAMAQVAAAGRLMGQENIQLVNAGFSPLLLLSEKTGKSMTRLKREMEDGAVSYELVADLLRESTNQGGRFFGLFDAMSPTVAGKLNRFTSEVDQLALSVGKLLEPATNGTLDKFNQGLALIRRDADTAGKVGGIGGAVLNFATGAANAGADPFAQFQNARNYYDALKAETTPIKLVQLQLQYYEWMYPVTEEIKKNAAEERKERQRIAAISDRVNKVFEKAVVKQRESLLAARYEKDEAERIKLLREQSVDEERKLIDQLTDRGATYEEIIFSVNTIAAAEAEELRVSQEQTAELQKQKEFREQARAEAEAAKREFDKLTEEIQQRNQQDRDNAAKELEAIKSKLQYEEDLIVLGEERARIEQLMREKNMTEDEAKALAQLERELKIREEIKSMAQKAADIAEANNPNADFVKTMAELEALRASGQLGEADFQLARKRALDQATQGAGGVNAAPVAEKGSQEAYQALTGQTVDKINTQIKIQEQQKILDENRNKILDKANELLTEIAKQKIKKVGP